MTNLARFGFASAALLTLCLGASNADAFYANPILTAKSAVVPVAMCGRTCRNGGRYFRGPPEVCAQNGLEYCGSSRGGREPGVGIVVPGTGIGIGVGPVPRESNCRTITVQRDDGSVRRVRRCD